MQPVPGPGGRWQISSGGGGQPRWNGDGKEIFYMGEDGEILAVPVDTRSGNFETGEAHRLFHISIPPVISYDSRIYDVLPDGKRFVVNTTAAEGEHEEVVVVTNWSAGPK